MVTRVSVTFGVMTCVMVVLFAAVVAQLPTDGNTNSDPNPKPETRNPKPETRNPKPETRNPKPETGNPKPETLIRTRTRTQTLTSNPNPYLEP
jgi:hypothetical protein